MNARRLTFVLVLIGLAAAGLRLWHLSSIRPTAFYHFDEAWTASDMHSNRAWAEHLAAGDWLDRNAYRPHFDWMDGVADPATWNRWFGPTTYYQPPLYPYLLALFMRATGGTDLFRWMQALVGAVNVVLIGFLARRVAGAGAAVVASIAVCAYAPFILYDAELLRGTFVITLNLITLLALDTARRAEGSDGGPGRPRNRWMMAGAALGLSYLADSAIVTFVPLAFLWAAFLAADTPARAEAEGSRRPVNAGARAGALRAAWLGVGFLIALVPLALRNIAVGAPIVSTTTRAPLAFVMGNAPDSHPVGASIPDSTAQILHASDYRTGATILETIRAHHGLGSFLSLQWKKLFGLFDSYEVPDNPSLYYAALHSPVLASGPRFACVAGFGLVGLVLAARRAREHSLLLLYLLGFLALFVFAHVVSRYRQPLVIPLAVYAGLAISVAARAARDRRFAVAAAVVLGSIALSFALPRTPPPGYRYYRAAEFLVAASRWESEGDVNRAASEIRRALALADQDNAQTRERVDLSLELGELYYRHERYPEALDAFRDVLEDDPRNAVALATTGAIWHDTNKPMEALETLLKAESVDPENPEVHARLGHLYWVVFHDGEKALPHIRKALELAPQNPAAASLSAMASDIAAKTGLTP